MIQFGQTYEVRIVRTDDLTRGSSVHCFYFVNLSIQDGEAKKSLAVFCRLLRFGRLTGVPRENRRSSLQMAAN
jgi:hypothetical protein